MTIPHSLRLTCPRCDKSLTGAEFVEQYCNECGDVRPKPTKTEDKRKAA